MGNNVIMFSDLHAHGWSEFADPVHYKGDTINSRLLDAVNVIREVKREALRHKALAVIFAGDLFHRRRLLDVPVFNIVAHELKRLSKIVELYLVAGNHDLVAQNKGRFSQEHALSSLASKRIHVIGEPAMILDTFGVVPYVADRPTLLTGIEKVSKARALILHAGVSGATTGALEFQPFEPVTTADLPTIPIYSGHYHRPQKVDHVRYIGAPLELVRGEPTPEAGRGFLWVDVDNPKSNRMLVHKGPQFVRWELSKDFNQPGLEGNFVDIIVRNEMTEEDSTRLLRKFTHCSGARSATIVYAPQPKTKMARLKIKTEKGAILPSVHELCDLYATESCGNLDPKRLRAIAKDALAEAETRGQP